MAIIFPERQFIRLTGQAALPTGGGTGYTNYAINSTYSATNSATGAGGEMETLTATNFYGNTITVDTTGTTSGATLNLNTYTLKLATTNGLGGMLFIGPNPYSINNGNIYDNGTVTGEYLTFTNMGAGVVTLGPTFSFTASNTYGLVYNGDSEFILSGSSAYKLPTTIDGGTIVDDQSTYAFSSASSGAVTVNNGATVQIQGGITQARTITLNGAGAGTNLAATATGALENVSGNNTYSGAVTLGSASVISSDTAGNTLTLSGGINTAGYLLTLSGPGNTTVSTTGFNETGGLTKNGSGVFTVSTASTFTGSANINGGTLSLGANLVDNGNITTSGTSLLSQTAGVISGTGNFTQDSTGSSTFTGANTYSGQTLVEEGNLTYKGSATSASTSLITLGVTGAGNAAEMTFLPSTSLTTTVTGELAFDGSVAGGTDGYNFIVNAASAPGSQTEKFGALVINEGMMDVNLVPNSSYNLNVTFASIGRSQGGILYLGESAATPGAATIAAETANTANVVFTTAPRLFGNNTSAGNDTNNGAGTPSIGILPYVDLNDGNLATYDTLYGLRPLASTELTALASGLSTGTVAANTVTAGQNAKFSGTTALSAATTINALQGSGTVSFNADTTTLTITSGALMANGNATFGSGTVGTNGKIAFGPAEGIVYAEDGVTLTLNSSLTGTGGVTYVLDDDTGTTANIVLSGSNTYTGVTNLDGNNSSLQVHLTNTNAFQNTTVNYNNNGASFTFGNGGVTGQTAYTFGGLEGAQNLSLSNNNTTAAAVALTVGGDNDTLDVYTGVLSDGSAAGGSLKKVGTGTLDLASANTYTGGTTISQGNLEVTNNTGSGTGTGAVSITGGILSGNGIVAPGLSNGMTVGAAGNIDPGTTPVGMAPQGYLTYTAGSAANALTLSAGSSSAPQLTFNVGLGAAPTDSSGVTYAGGSSFLKLSNNVTGEMVFNGNYLTINDLTSGNLAVGNYLLVEAGSDSDYSGLTTSGGVDANGLITQGLLISSSSSFASDPVYLSNGDIYLSLVAVPEPSTWVLLLGGLGFLGVMSYRRHQRGAPVVGS